jgi:hypothetical protein
MAVLPTTPAHQTGVAAVERGTRASSAIVAGARDSDPRLAQADVWYIPQPPQASSEASATGTSPAIRVTLNRHSAGAEFAAGVAPCWLDHGSA